LRGSDPEVRGIEEEEEEGEDGREGRGRRDNLSEGSDLRFIGRFCSFIFFLPLNLRNGHHQ
jgi:hypothetical protein